jgi:hypothetical protein
VTRRALARRPPCNGRCVATSRYQTFGMRQCVQTRTLRTSAPRLPAAPTRHSTIIHVRHAARAYSRQRRPRRRRRRRQPVRRRRACVRCQPHWARTRTRTAATARRAATHATPCARTIRPTLRASPLAAARSRIFLARARKHQCPRLQLRPRARRRRRELAAIDCARVMD